MKAKLLMLDTPIIVSDEEIQDGDKIINLKTNNIFNADSVEYLEKHNIIEDFNKSFYINSKNSLKIIAGIEGLPSIDWNGLEEEFGWVDIEKITKSLYLMEEGNWQMNSITSERRRAFKEGFKKAQSLNEKKFSLEDMEGFIDYMYSHKTAHKYKDGYGDFQVFTDLMRQYIQSLQQPKVFDIEVEMERIIPNPQTVTKEYDMDDILIVPKITNNSIKIIKKL